jgi:hypothetical protein
MGYRLISYGEAKELLAREEYKYLVGWYAFEASAKYYCRQVDGGELVCLKIWVGGGGKGGALFRGSPEEVCTWLRRDVGVLELEEIIIALWRNFGAVVDPRKIGSAYKSMLRKVLGVG